VPCIVRGQVYYYGNIKLNVTPFKEVQTGPCVYLFEYGHIVVNRSVPAYVV